MKSPRQLSNISNINMKKFVIIGLAAWILAPYLHAFQIGATIGTGIGSAKAFAGFSEVITTIFLWTIVIVAIIFFLCAVFGSKKKSKSTRYIER